MTVLQKAAVTRFLQETRPVEFHHGDCIGADAQASTLAELAGVRLIKHPPLNTSKQANMPCDECRKPAEYLERNRHIVHETDQLLACPGEITEQLRSGTWSTVRYARKGGRKVTIIYPDGSVK